jgi:tetratricopeptide (TPR) repeat protein
MEYSPAFKLLCDEKDYDGAIAEFSRFIDENPADTYALEWRGEAYRRKGDYGKALADYNRVLELEPDDSHSWWLRANHYRDTGDYDKAVADYSKGLSLDEDDPYNCLFNRGLSYYEKKDYKKALADFDRSLAENPDSTYVLDYRGDTYRRLFEYEKAVADFSRSLALRPDNGYALYMRGAVLFELKEYDKAIADFDKAIELDPNDVSYLIARGVVYYNRRSCEEDNDRAKEDFTRVIELAPENAEGYLNRGTAYLAAASEHFSNMKAVVLNRARDEAERLVMLRQLELKGLKDFIPRADRMLKALRRNMTKAEDMVMKGCSLLAQDYLEEAIEDLNKAESLDGGSDQLYYVRGRSYMRLGDRDAAIADYDRVLALNPCHEQAAKDRADLLANEQ